MSISLSDPLWAKIAAVPEIPKNKRGIRYHGECPCGGIILAWRCKDSGHLRAICNKCQWKLVE